MLKKYPFCTQRVATNVSVKLMEKQCIIIKPASEAIVLLQVDSTTNAEKEKKILLTQTKKLKVNTTYFKHFIQPWSTMIAICIRIRLYHQGSPNLKVPPQIPCSVSSGISESGTGSTLAAFTFTSKSKLPVSVADRRSLAMKRFVQSNWQVYC